LLPPPAPLSAFETTVTVVSWSPTGSVVGDGALGALVGYAAAPSTNSRTRWAVGGAAATGATGLFGLLATLGYAVWSGSR
jgi:hypothetical protein